MSKTHPPSPKEKLRILQEFDVWRKWETLDDQRRCVLCDQTFSARKITITLDRHGRPELHCPTHGCNSTPREWLHPGDPLTDDEAWHDWLRILDELDGDKPAPAATPRKKKQPARADADVS